MFHFVTYCCLALIFACIYFASLILEPGKYEAQRKFYVPSGKVNQRVLLKTFGSDSTHSLFRLTNDIDFPK